MSSTPALAESTTLPSFDQLLASLSQPEFLLKPPIPRDQARRGDHRISSTRTAPSSRPTTPPEFDPQSRTSLTPLHSQMKPSHEVIRPTRPPYGHLRRSSSMSTNSKHYEDRVKAIKCGEGWVHDDEMAPDVLPPWAKPHHTWGPFENSHHSSHDTQPHCQNGPIIRAATAAPKTIHPPPMSRSLSQGSHGSNRPHHPRPTPSLSISEYNPRHRSNSTHSPLSICSPVTPTFTHFRSGVRDRHARREGHAKRHDGSIKRSASSAAVIGMRLPTLPQMK